MAVQQFYNSPWLTGIRPNDAKNNTSAFAAPDPWRLMQLGNQSNMNEAYAGGYNSWTNPQPQPKQQQTNPIMRAYLQGKTPQDTQQEGSQAFPFSGKSPFTDAWSLRNGGGRPDDRYSIPEQPSWNPYLERLRGGENMSAMQAQNNLVTGSPLPTDDTPYTISGNEGYIPPWMKLDTMGEMNELSELYRKLYEQYADPAWIQKRESDWQTAYNTQRQNDYNLALNFMSQANAAAHGFTGSEADWWNKATFAQRLELMKRNAQGNPTWDAFKQYEKILARMGTGPVTYDERTGETRYIQPGGDWEHIKMQARKNNEFGTGADSEKIKQYLAGQDVKLTPELVAIADKIRAALTGQSDDMIQFAKGLSPESYSGFRRMYGPMTGREMNIQQYLSLLPSEKLSIEGDWDEWGYNAEDEWAKLLAAAPKGEANPYQRYMSWQ